MFRLSAALRSHTPQLTGEVVNMFARAPGADRFRGQHNLNGLDLLILGFMLRARPAGLGLTPAQVG